VSVIWHEVECGSYAADLPLWEELAARHGDPVLDLGCGAGRVALHLARRGHGVHGVDLDEELVATLNSRAPGLPARAEVGDARELMLGREFPLILAPMQLVQLLDGPAERDAMLSGIRAHLRPGGVAAMAIADDVPEGTAPADTRPDAREVDGWVYSSLPLETVVDDGWIRIRRLRQTVSPLGTLGEEVDEVGLCPLSAAALESEARAAGLRPAGRASVEASEDHVGSTVVLLSREG
jgi:SAM-dependent methyltransferase